MKYLVIPALILTLAGCAKTGADVSTGSTLTQLITATCGANIPALFIEAARLEAGPGAALSAIAQLACSIFADPAKMQRASVRAVSRRLARS